MVSPGDRWWVEAALPLFGPWPGPLPATLIALFLFWVCWGLGRSLLRAAGLLPAHPLEEAVLSLGVGAGSLPLILLGLGALGGYRTAPLAALLLALGGVAAFATRSLFTGGRRPALPFPLPRGQRALAALLAAAVLLTWLAALSPPLFYDALVYHLGVPNLYLLNGGIARLPGVVYSDFPLGMEMHYLLALSLGGAVVAGLVNFGFGLAATAAVACLARRLLGASAALPAAAFFFLTPTLFLLSRYCTVESALAFHVLLALCCLALLRDEGDPRWALLAGVFGGFAFGVKYLGAVYGVLLPLLLAAFLPGARGNRVAALWRIALASSLAAAPWLVKSALLAGNPVHPVFHALFGGDGWSREQAALLAVDAHAAWAGEPSLRGLLRPAWDLLAGGGDLGAAAQAPGYWLLVAAAAVVVWRSGRERRFPVAALLLFLVAWGATFRLARFLLPAMGLASLLLAGAAARVGVRPWLAALALLAAGSVAVAGDRPTWQAFGPVLGSSSPAEYLRSSLRSWPAMEYADRNLPAAARVLLIGETRVAYLRRPHLFNTALDRPLLPQLGAGSAGAGGLAAALLRQGVTHVLVNVPEMKRLEGSYPLAALDPAWRDRLFDLLREQGRELYGRNQVYLYELLPPPG